MKVVTVSLTLMGMLVTKTLGQFCSGTETFEKVTGVTLPSARRTPLYASQGNTVTAECNNRCRASQDCPSYLIDYSASSCWRLDTNTEEDRDLITPGGLDNKTNYFEKICLNAPACERAWIYERVVGYLLEGYDDRVVGAVTSRRACQELCLVETEFQCSSAEYEYERLECRLSKETRRSQPGSFRASTANVDYLENQCARERRSASCQFEQYEGRDIGYADIQVTDVRGQEECGARCDQTSAFNCRSYTFFPGSGVCRLSGDDQVSAGTGSLTERPGADFYQRLPCLDRDNLPQSRVQRQVSETSGEGTEDDGEVSLVCTGESMTVTLATEEPFTGRLFAQEAGRSCETKGAARKETSLTFNFEGEGAARCGVEREEGGVYSNVVVVQHHPVIQRKGDRAVQLYCFFETGSKTVTNSYDVLADTIDGGIGISTPSSVVNATAPSPGVRLRITTETGEDISGTRLGEKLFLRIEMDGESIFGIFARNLKAIGGDNEDSIDLLDDKGCPTDPLIFPGLQQIPGSRDLQGSFEAFKFSDTTVVRFQVNVQFCVDECNAVDCGNGLLSYGRKRRSALPVNSRSTVTLPPYPTTPDQPSPYANRLVYDPNLDQEVIYSDTPLSMEIRVDSGTKVDSFRDPSVKSGSEETGVFIRADYDGEVVCTTWPVIIATGAAVVFLQLCIISTCLLCLYTSRRDRRNPSKHVDVMSLQSSSLAPPTLYHDQLTYRPPAPPSTSYSRATEHSASTLKSLRTSLRD